MLIYLQSLADDEGDRRAFTQLFHQYHARMEAVARRILPQQKDAEDAVQNAFLQVIKHFQKFYQIPCEELPFWLICITKNEALMIRRKDRHTLPLEDWDDAAVTVEPQLEHGGLLELFSRLPEPYRAVLEMKLLLGYTDREIARHLGLTETAVSTRANRGRAMLRELAEKEGLHP